MRDGWNRATAVLELTRAELNKLIEPAFPGQEVLEFEHTKGGLANTNIRLRLSGRERCVLLRLFVRDPGQAEKEYRLQALIDGIVPSATAIYFSRDGSIIEHPYMILEWIDGERLETVAFSLRERELRELGKSVGAALAAVHSISFPHAGFLDGQLRIPEALNMGGDGLIAFAHQCLKQDIGGTRLGAQLTEEVMSFVGREAGLLDEWNGRPCLSHSDFGGSNILVNLVESSWQVVAVVDWEFAFSGTPFFDFGNLLRKPLGALPGFEESVYAGYTAYGGTLPAQWRRMSLLADLTAWFEFLTRPEAGDRLIQDARSVIQETMSSWHAERNNAVAESMGT